MATGAKNHHWPLWWQLLLKCEVYIFQYIKSYNIKYITLHFFAKCITRLCKMYYTYLQYVMYCRTLTYSPPPLMAPSTKTTLVPSTLHRHQHQTYSYVSIPYPEIYVNIQTKVTKKAWFIVCDQAGIKVERGRDGAVICLQNYCKWFKLPQFAWIASGAEEQKMAEKYKSKNYILFSLPKIR